MYLGGKKKTKTKTQQCYEASCSYDVTQTHTHTKKINPSEGPKAEECISEQTSVSRLPEPGISFCCIWNKGRSFLKILRSALVPLPSFARAWSLSDPSGEWRKIFGKQKENTSSAGIVFCQFTFPKELTKCSGQQNRNSSTQGSCRLQQNYTYRNRFDSLFWF